MYKYETTLAELDVILRSDKRDKSVFELKKLVENQLKQILVLQKEVELARQGLGDGPGPLVAPQIVAGQESESLKEIEQLKFKLGEQRMANEEIISERRSLMDLIESLEN